MVTAEDEERARRLGEYIRMQRQMADLSLRGMAELTKVSNAYLSQIERGLHQPSLRVLQAIAAALHIPADTLMAHAGLGSEPSDDNDDRRGRTEEAIRADADLKHDEREMLLRVYRSFLEGRSATS